jgi:hypothetical protein
MMEKELQNFSRDTVFASLFSSLDEEDADIGTAYLTSGAQGSTRTMLAQEWAQDAFPHSVLKSEYQGLTVGALFNIYMRGRQGRSVAQELVLQRSLRVAH